MIEVSKWGRDEEDFNGRTLGEIFYVRINNGPLKPLGKADLIKAIKMNLPESGESDEFDTTDARTTSLSSNGNRDAVTG